MSDLGQAIAFASRLYVQRARIAYAGHFEHDPMALLDLRPGRVNPYALYDWIRQSGPLSPTRLGNWVSPSHRVCDAVLRDPRFGTHAARAEEPDPLEGFDVSLQSVEPPDQARLRRLAGPTFSSAAVASHRELIERTAGGLLDRALAAGQFDVVSAFAAPLAIGVLSDLFGVPDADAADFARHATVIVGASDGVQSVRHAKELKTGNAALRQLFEKLFDLRRREPGTDLVSTLVAAEGGEVKPDELLPICMLLLVSGFETAANLIGNAVLALLDHPEQWRALCGDPAALAPKAVEEALRFDPPIQRAHRIALEPLELEGKAVRKGQLVVALLGAANRDPEAYENPDTFDIGREGGPEHLAFSGGGYSWLGQPLARLEAEIALRMLAERIPGLSQAGPVQRRNTTVVRGPLSLPVTAGSVGSVGSVGA